MVFCLGSGFWVSGFSWVRSRVDLGLGIERMFGARLALGTICLNRK